MKSISGWKKIHWLWGLVPAVVILELAVQWRIPHSVPDDSDWARASESIEKQKATGDLVIVAPRWADQGRKHLANLMSFKDFGRFDITRYDRLFEVAAFGAKAAETRGIELTSRRKFGNVEVRTYDLPKKAEVLYDFRDHLKTAVREGIGSLSPKIMIDREFSPRYAIPVSLRKRRVSLTFKDVPLKGVLRGYGFLDYREARYNKGTAVAFRIYIDGKQVSEQHTENFDSITPFTIELTGSAKGDVRFEIMARDNLKREFGFSCDVRQGSAGHG